MIDGSGRQWTRRSALLAAGAVGAGVAVDRLFGDGQGGEPRARPTPDDSVPFYGVRQSGIDTAAQEFLAFASYDLTAESLDSLRYLLIAWTTAAATLTRGEPYELESLSGQTPSMDTGEAVGLSAASLTITFGLGRSLFTSGQRDRLGLQKKMPPSLDPLPTFRGEDLDPRRSDGDLCVQACADDAQVAFHALHVLTRVAEGAATLRWGQQGFGRTSSTSRSQKTPRNLMGFKDGTVNIRAEDQDAMTRFVWVGDDDGPAWMAGGTYLVVRRIRILFDVWDASTVEEQERVIGRHKLSGAPLGGHDEYDPVDLSGKVQGVPTIPTDAHIRLASSDYNHGERILRRGYSYSEAPEPGSGQLDAGLFFICFQRDPQRQFVPIQRRLAASDALNRHTLHDAGAVFACPAGVRKGGFIGEALFD